MAESDGDAADGDEDGDGYVHRPSGEPPQQAEPTSEFGRHGWALIGMLVLAFFVIPGAIYVLPAAETFIESLGLTLRAAYLTLPLVPAFVLGLLAVWSALRSRAG